MRERIYLVVRLVTMTRVVVQRKCPANWSVVLPHFLYQAQCEFRGSRSSSDLLGNIWNRLATDLQVWESDDLGAVTLHLEFVIARGI